MQGASRPLNNASLVLASYNLQSNNGVERTAQEYLASWSTMLLPSVAPMPLINQVGWLSSQARPASPVQEAVC